MNDTPKANRIRQGRTVRWQTRVLLVSVSVSAVVLLALLLSIG